MQLKSEAQTIIVTNYIDTRVVTYPMVLLRGTLSGTGSTALTVTNTSSDRGDTRVMPGLVRSGRFRALADLVPGENHLVLTSGTVQLNFTLRYEPQTNGYMVRPVLYTLSNGSTLYQTPLSNDPQNWQAKLGTMMKIMQTFTAESMHDRGYPRLTFNLPMNPQTGAVEVKKLVSPHNAAFYHNQSYDRDQLWYEAFYDLIPQQMPDSKGKFLGIISFSKYDPALNYKYAHTALGTANLGIMGGLSLWACPDSIADILPTYMDGTTAYPEIQGESSKVYLAANENIGAALHELGHALGRPHEGDYGVSIMQRGFDQMYRMFTLAEPGGSVWPAGEEGAWSAESATAFADGHPWFEYPPPVAELEDVTPDPLPEALNAIAVHFDQPVTGLTISNFTLIRNGTLVPGFTDGAVLKGVSAAEYVIEFGALTAPMGTYALNLHASAGGSGIINGAGKPLYEDKTESWTQTGPSLPMLTEVRVQEVTSSSATLSFRLATTGGSPADVTVVWGGSDAGTNTAAWETRMPLGNLSRGLHAVPLSGFPAGRKLFVRITAVNSLGAAWTPGLQFTAEKAVPSIDVTRPGFNVTGSSTNFPTGESPKHAIDNTASTKYLNFDKGGSGFTVSLSAPRVVRSLNFISADDAPERDPASYQLHGSNDGVSFSPITSGALSFPSRFFSIEESTGTAPAYSHYKVVFPSVAGPGTADSMQIAEVQLLEYRNILDGATITGTTAPGNPMEGAGKLNDGFLETKMGVTGAQTLTIVPRAQYGNFVVRGLNLISADDNASYAGRSPSSITLSGSQDGVNYTTIFTNNSPGRVDTNYTISEHTFVENETACKRYRLTLGASPAGFMQISEIQLFGMDGNALQTRIIGLAGNLSFGSVNAGQSPQRTLIITNTGNTALEVAGITHSDPAFSGTFTGVVAAGSTQNVPVYFSPDGERSYSNTITVNSNKTSGGSIITSTGSGILTRIIELSGNLAFGNVLTGQSAQRILVVTNTGGSPLEVTEITYSNPAFSGVFSGIIEPGATRNITITFAPAASQSYSATLTVNSNSTSGIGVYAISGTGTPTRILNLTGDFNFGEIPAGQSVQRTFVLSNTGSGPLQVTGVNHSNAAFSGGFTGSIAAGGTQSLTVTFSPSAAQTYRSAIGISSDKTGGMDSFTLTGAGLPTRIIGLSGNLNFGDVPVGRSAERTLTISNTGVSALNVAGLVHSDPAFSGTFSGDIAPGASRDVIIFFSPAANGSYSQALIVNSNSTSGNGTLGATGRGVLTRVLNLMGDLAFGEVPVGQTMLRTLTLSNTGSATLTINDINFPTGFSGDWTKGAVPAGESRKITVNFAPSIPGFYDGAVTISADHTSGEASIGISGIGTEGGFTEWKRRHFTEAEMANASISGPLADPDGDGAANLLEYALQKDPRRFSGLEEMLQIIARDGQKPLSLTVVHPVSLPPRVKLYLEEAGDGGTWTPLSVLSSATNWNGILTPAATEPFQAGAKTTFSVPPPEEQRSFFRLRVMVEP